MPDIAGGAIINVIKLSITIGSIKKTTVKQITIPTNKGGKTVSLEHIIRVQANSNYCKIYFSNDYPLTVAKVLLWFEHQLPSDFFCRIHRTHIINRSFVSNTQSSHLLKLITGETFQISRRKRKLYSPLLKLASD